MKTIYIRKLRYRDAEEKLERELHEAFLSGINFVEVVHGDGSGKLRQLVQDKIKDMEFAKIIRDEALLDNLGSTNVELFPPDPKSLKLFKY